MASELSLTLSIPQLLQFRVCLGLTDGPPSLHLDTSQPSLSAPTADYSGVDVKIETHIVNGQRTLRVFAAEKPGQQQSAKPSSLPPATSTFYNHDLYSSQPNVGEQSAAPSPQMSSQALPVSYDFPIQDTFMNDMSSMSYSNPASFSAVLGSTDSTFFQDFMQSQAEHDQRIISIPSYDTHEQLEQCTRAPPPSEATTPAVSRSATPTPTLEKQSTGAEQAVSRKRPRRFPCLDPSCPRRFASKYTLNLHMTTHRQSPRVRYPCEMGCAETFSRQHDRLRHEVSKHGRVCEWLCNRCRHVFSTQGTRDKHRCAEVNLSSPDSNSSGS
ncbi:hypothetical protein CONPUDRAFT_140410 [Coniophora puteana RWD-64-598 SS2]|uniref:C2H2-type domain-containing protein n=1 Tax=Coniophora puteana (strain RWD-64-598) TaxID=741705 RepID=R7SHQ6_CONPW|nr:uncharacterized protein CONPUDRAFT_140410 [Coniophora puteana RWD-64-598 SS2]EIW74604.1 hypothetical protein CONPUDRAFT_140410 [Coniophora puteana RWD-64-598 SS2]